MQKEAVLKTQVYLVTTDLWRGNDGLARFVEGKLTPSLFCGRKRDCLKGLLWEGDRFLLLYKWLDNGPGIKQRRDRKLDGCWKD